MIRLFKKLFSPRVTDKKVDEINAESKALLKDATKSAKSNADLLKKNGVTLQIYIAAGGGKHGR